MKRSVLVVEDHFMTRWSAAEFLRRLDFHVIEAVSAEEAKRVLSSGSGVDVIFSDVNMPGGDDGYALAQWVAEHYPALPMLLTSGDDEDASAYSHGPLRRFVRKPYETGSVAATLRELLGAAAP